MLFILFDTFHKHRLGWFGAFFWDFVVLFGAIVVLACVFLVSLGVQRVVAEKQLIKISARYIFGSSKTAFLLAIRAGQGVLGFLLLSKMVFYFCYYRFLSAEEYQDIFMSLPTNLLWFRMDYGIHIIIFVLLVLFFGFLQYSYFFFTTRSHVFSYAFEFLILLLLLMLGLLLVIVANDLVLLLLALELVSFCVIVFIVMDYRNKGVVTPGTSTIEAGVKYFLINAISVFFLLVAMGGFYSVLGTLNLVKLQYAMFLVPGIQVVASVSLAVTLVIFILGFLMKVGAGPFQMWVIDVYDGTDFYITSLFLGIVSPTFFAKFVLLLKTFTVLNVHDFLFLLVYVSGILSIVFGSLGALMQMQLKRFLAYSSLTHVGFMLLALSCNTLLGYCAVWGYLFGYLLMTHGFLFIFFFVRMKYPHLVFTSLNHLRFFHYGGISLVVFLTGLFFSFAGIPPLGGFFSKFAIFCVLFEVDAYGTMFFLVFFVLIDAYVYLRLIRLLLFEEPTQRLRGLDLDSGPGIMTKKEDLVLPVLVLMGSGGSVKPRMVFSDYPVVVLSVVGGISLFLGGFIFFAPWFCPGLVDFVLLLILFS